MPGPDAPEKPSAFTLVTGGPLYRAYIRSHLAGTEMELLHRRVLFLVALAWLPLALCAFLDGSLAGHGPMLPFLTDAAVHARLLVAVPLLVGTEVLVHRRIRNVIDEFLRRNLVPAEQLARFHATVGVAIRWRNSTFAELALVALAYLVAVGAYQPFAEAAGLSTWFVAPADGGMRWSRAGLWYGWVSMPMFQFLVLRWYYRIVIWTGLLVGIARIPLQLVPTHPDRLGGLGFLVAASSGFVPLAAVHGTLLAGLLANRILHMGDNLADFTVEIAAVTLLVWLVVFGPLAAFSLQLVRAKRKGLQEYGRLAETYVRGFEAKWLHRTRPPDETLLGSADVQSLADLGNSYAMVGQMQPLPLSRDAVLRVSAATLLPLSPLLLTIMPLEQILRRLVGMFL